MDLNSFKNHGVRSIGRIFTILISTFVLAACGGGGQESVTTGVGGASKPVSQASEAATGPINVYQTGQRIMATLAGPKSTASDQDMGGANSRNEALTVVLFTQQAGVHGTLVGSLIVGSSDGFTGNWWKIEWDSEPPNQNGYQGRTAESRISLVPYAGDVPKPDLSSRFYTDGNNNPLFPDYAPTSVGGNLASLGNCTWYANGRLRELGYNSIQLDALIGNANVWVKQAGDAGILVDIFPTVGSIAQLADHVAVVESMNADGSITVSESSYIGASATSGDSAWNFLWRNRTISRADPSWPTNFIHVALGN